MHRPGFTLVELALTLVVMGLLLAAAVPRVAGVVAGIALRGARADILAGLDAARGTAIRTATTVALAEESGTLVVRGVGADTARHWRGRHPRRRGVSVAGLAPPLLFAPDGLATGVSNRTVRLAIAGRERRVVLSRLGRIR